MRSIIFSAGVRVFASPCFRLEGIGTEGGGVHKGLRLAHADGKGSSRSRAETKDNELTAVRSQYGGLTFDVQIILQTRDFKELTQILLTTFYGSNNLKLETHSCFENPCF